VETLKMRAKELLTDKTVELVIGYAQGPSGTIKPVFLTSPADTDCLVCNEHCRLNLAVYLTKPALKKLGKVAIVAPVSTRRSILQLISENQVDLARLVVLGLDPDGKFAEISDVATLEQSVVSQDLGLSAEAQGLIAKIEHMSPEERLDYWTEQLSACIKCYACRAACPLCYCSRCVIETNQPQWVPVAAHTLGNIEWHINRAMHLAGRCINCGACQFACPLNIPLHLLTQKLSDVILNQFNERAGTSSTGPYSLATFKTDDKENFIG